MTTLNISPDGLECMGSLIKEEKKKTEKIEIPIIFFYKKLHFHNEFLSLNIY